jgi:hypothetical protein
MVRNRLTNPSGSSAADAVARRARVTRAVGGLGLVVAAAPLSQWLADTTDGARWAQRLHDLVSDQSGVWRLMRGGLAYVAIPALLVLLALMALACYRRSVRRAALLVITVVIANLSVQLVKHAPFGFADDVSRLNPLSGHVGVAASACLTWMVVAPPGRRRGTAPASGLIIGGVAFGVIMAGWHTPWQVLCSLMLCTGWAVVSSAFVVPAHLPAADCPSGRLSSLTSTALGLALAGGSWALLALPERLSDHGWAPVGVLIPWIAGLCVAAVGLVDAAAACQPSSAPHEMRPRRAPMDDWLRSARRSEPAREPVDHTTRDHP